MSPRPTMLADRGRSARSGVGTSHSRYVPLKAGLPLPSSCCKGEACLPRLHYKGEASSPKWCNIFG